MSFAQTMSIWLGKTEPNGGALPAERIGMLNETSLNKRFEELLDIEQKEIRKTAVIFYRENRDRVRQLADNAGALLAPTGVELFRPDRWRGFHWRWFIKKNLLA